MSGNTTDTSLPAFKTADDYLQNALDNGFDFLEAKGFHELLKVNTDFDTWREEMRSYGFEDEDDFQWLAGVDEHEPPAYLLTVECAQLLLRINSNKVLAQRQASFLQAKVLEIMALTTEANENDDFTVTLPGKNMIAIKEALRAMLLVVD